MNTTEALSKLTEILATLQALPLLSTPGSTATLTERLAWMARNSQIHDLVRTAECYALATLPTEVAEALLAVQEQGWAVLQSVQAEEEQDA